MKTFNILMLCGIGDVLSHITRFPFLEKEYPTCNLKIWLGGVGRSVQFMKEILECETFNNLPIEVSIIKNLTYHNQLPQMREFLKNKVEKEGGHLQDWSFCEEIFQNLQPVFMEYPMKPDYDYKYRETSEMFKFKPINYSNAVAIQPLTKSGNAEGFESDLEKGRFWSLDNWKKICDYLHQDDYQIILTGYGDEDWGLFDYCKEKGYNVSSYVGHSVADTFELLTNVQGNICCNSWTWEITSRLNIPTVCFYTKNHFFIQNHMPPNDSKTWNNTFIETSVDRSPEDIYGIFKHIYINRQRPEVEYSVCMITTNDEDCIEKTIENISPYTIYNWSIVDGGSTDKTKEILASRGFSWLSKKWEDDFEVQKNYALDNATKEWRVWIDADETYEPIFWNQLPWYIWLSEKNGIDCINVPRINTITGVDDSELNELVQRNGWYLTGFNWINYPDYQQRVFKSNCRFVGRTHERIVGDTKSMNLVGVHCLHPKTKQRQDRGLERENKQYEIEAEKVYERVMKDE